MHEMMEFEKMESYYSEVEGTSFHERIQNPMWLDLILDRIFTFLPKSALANCRLVCRQWLEVSERHFIARNHQSPTTVIIKDTDSLLTFLSTFVQRRDFTSDSDSMACPWVSYKLTFQEITPLQLEFEKVLALERKLQNYQISPIQPMQHLDFDDVSPFQRQLFMNICGDSMTKIFMYGFHDTEIISALSMFLLWTPQLESLELSCKVSNDVLDPENQQPKSNFEYPETLNNCHRPFFTHLRRLRLLSVDVEDVALEDVEPIFSGVFQLMPHLQDFGVLHVTSDSRCRPDLVIASIIQALRVQIQVKDQEKSQVTQNSQSFLGQMVSLQLPYLTDQHLHDLHQFSLYNSLRLEKFWLVNFWTCLDPQNLLTFLQGQAETLQTLCLAPYAAILILQCPLSFTLDHVTTLKIFFWDRTLHQCCLFVSHILAHFPNLKKLTICERTGDLIHCTDVMSPQLMQKLAVEQIKLRTARMSSNTVTCDQLTTIRFSGSNSYQEDKELLTWLTKLCPNVTDLELRFSSSPDTLAVRPVFDGWRKLKRLVIYSSGWKEAIAMDSYFTGVEHQENQSSLQRFCTSVMEKLQGRDGYIDHEDDKGREWETEKKFPSLLLLQELRTLEIYTGYEDMELFKIKFGVRERWFLSDLIVWTTLSKMPRLREFCISHSLISPSVLRALNDALDLEKCLVGDKDGKLIQFKAEVKDQACDNEKGRLDNIDRGLGGQESANAKRCQSLENPPGHDQDNVLSLFFEQEKFCCSIV